MKISLLLSFFAFLAFSVFKMTPTQPMAERNYPEYLSYWNEVEQFQAQGLIDDALQKIEFIYKLAIQDVNHPQIYKCLLSIEALQVQKDEAGQQGIILRLEKSLKDLKEPSSSLLKSVLGQLYFNFNQYGYGRNSKTNIEGIEQDSADLNTWSPNKMIAKANEYYLLSIQNKSLENESTLDYLPIMYYKQDSTLRPSLYDVLLYRAIEHFKNTTTQLTDFNISIPKEIQFSNLEVFLKADVSSHQVFQLYKEVLLKNKKDNNIEALIDADLNRLKYALSLNESKEEKTLFLKALMNSFDAFKQNNEAAHIQLEIATYYLNNNAVETNESNADQKKNLIKVDSICDYLIQTFPKSHWIKNAQLLKQQIRTQNLQVSVEDVYLVQKPIKFLMTHRNLSKAYFRLYKLPFRSINDQYEMNQDNMEAQLKKFSLVKEWEESWPASNDFVQHSVELKLDGLKSGQYYLMVNNSKDIMSAGIMQGGAFQVSNLASIKYQIDNQFEKIIVVQRDKGAPIKGAKVVFFESTNRGYSASPNFKIFQTSTTDAEGMVIIPKREHMTYYVSLKDDILLSQDWLYNMRYPQEQIAQVQYQFFTDRSIYRPGQIVYFKTLTTIKDKDQLPKIKSAYKFVVQLINPNGQEVSKVNLVTNSFGSAQGSFILPNTGLNGSFNLVADHYQGSQSIQVEEYKRPNFEIIFDTLTSEIKMNQPIQVLGKVQTYNGIPVSNAIVKYRISKSIFMPYYPWWSYYKRFPDTKEQIEFGQITTDDAGQFNITYTPKSENSDSELKPIIHYSIEADATDLNGETHSQTKGINVSEQSVFISTNLKPYFSTTDLKSIEIKLNNIEKNPIAAELHVKIWSLQAPKNHLRSRYWAKPDVMKYSQAEFKSMFPYDIYETEDQMNQWKEVNVVLDQKFSSASVFNIDFIKSLEEGAYKLIIEAKAKDGTIEKLTEYTVVYDKSSKKSAIKPYLINHQEILEPNSQALFTALSMDDDYHLLINYTSRSLNQLQWKKINKNSLFEYPVTEADRGGVFINSVCVFQNRIYNQSQQVAVPWSNKELQINSISFRDKLLPGQPEEWTFEIKDRSGKVIPSELLASMYDASLDQILPHQWSAYLWPDFYMRSQFVSSNFHSIDLNYLRFQPYVGDQMAYVQEYSSLNFFGLPMADFSPIMMESASMDAVNVRGGRTASPRKYKDGAPQAEGSALQEDQQSKKESTSNSTATEDKKNTEVQIRKNLNETVFFYPQLKTNEQGKVTFSFTMNEAMTKWKLQMFAHSVDLKYGLKTLEVVTRKPVQIKPYYPRFFRQGDQMVVSATVSNLSEEAQVGQTQIMILDPITMADITSSLVKSNVSQNFDLKTNQTISYKWTIQIPKDELRPLLVRFIAKGNTHSDGEETIIPVVTNRKLITESLPLPIGSKESKSFVFLPLQKLNSSPSASPHSLSLEFTSHPVWYAIQNLPYIMEYPHECSEQLMSRIYANTIGSYVMNQYPKVAATLKQIQNEGTNISPLLKNEELKSALIEETPWVLSAQNESEQMKRVSLLMDLNTMAQGLESALSKLESRQDANGSWSWFPGGRYDWYITQHIILEIAHLQRLGAIQKNKDRFEAIVNRAKPFLESMIKQQYELLAKEVKAGRTTWEDNHLGYMELMFMYCKSYFPDWKSDDTFQAIQNYYLLQMNNYWHSSNIYHEGICALIASRNNKKDLAQLITKSLSQRAIKNPELGMYWKNSWSYNWYELPIETQALMVEVYYEVTKNQKDVDALKVWLLKNKQTQHWGTTKATTAAIYALLAFGPNTIEESTPVEVTIGNKEVEVTKVEAGSGYFKKQWSPTEINASMASIQVKNPNKSIAWGAVYYQYFEDLDKVNVYKETPLILDKQLFIKEDSKKGPVLKPITDQTKIKIGDKVTARIIIKVDRPMDYVHLKVMRASGLEPIVQLSGYQWDGGLGYYRSPRDLATDFFFSYLPKGTHVLEYDLMASFKGDFSDGVSTIQSMYAPEFGSHSKGIRIVIGE